MFFISLIKFSRILVIFIFIQSVYLVSCSSKEEIPLKQIDIDKPEILYKNAIEQLDKKNYQEAISKFENVYFTPRISNFYEDLSTKSTASKNLKKQSGSYLESTFSYGLDFDMRNQRFQTTEGFRSNFSQTIPLLSEEYSLGNVYDFKTWYKFLNCIKNLSNCCVMS